MEPRIIIRQKSEPYLNNYYTVFWHKEIIKYKIKKPNLVMFIKNPY